MNKLQVRTVTSLSVMICEEAHKMHGFFKPLQDTFSLHP